MMSGAKDRGCAQGDGLARLAPGGQPQLEWFYPTPRRLAGETPLASAAQLSDFVKPLGAHLPKAAAADEAADEAADAAADEAADAAADAAADESLPSAAAVALAELPEVEADDSAYVLVGAEDAAPEQVCTSTIAKCRTA
jgi:hypothetical protein